MSEGRREGGYLSEHAFCGTNLVFEGDGRFEFLSVGSTACGVNPHAPLVVTAVSHVYVLGIFVRWLGFLILYCFLRLAFLLYKHNTAEPDGGIISD